MADNGNFDEGTDYEQFDEWIGSLLLGSYAVPNPWLLASSALAAARSSMPLEVRKNLERQVPFQIGSINVPSTKSCNHIQKGDKHRQGQVWRLGANTGALSHLLASSSVL